WRAMPVENKQNQNGPVVLAISAAFLGMAGTWFRGWLSLVLAGLCLVLVIAAIALLARNNSAPSPRK
ncbi:MAG: hypothetical protein ACRD4F_02070, partial [Candidatus Angelobacter sp.]